MVAESIEDKSFETIDMFIEGSIVPYTRMTQRGKYVKPDARRYLDSQNRLKILMQQEVAHLRGDKPYCVPEKGSFGIDIDFNMKKMHHCDLDNLVKAVMDAAQGVIFENDRYCDFIRAKRVGGVSSDLEGIHIMIYSLEDDDIPY